MTNPRQTWKVVTPPETKWVATITTEDVRNRAMASRMPHFCIAQMPATATKPKSIVADL